MNIENQILARKRLIWSAKMAKIEGFSMSEWESDEQVTEFCQESELDVSLLEHISWFVWKPLNGD